MLTLTHRFSIIIDVQVSRQLESNPANETCLLFAAQQLGQSR
jgi:hypothetical protein